MVAPFEADLITVRFWEGMTIANAAGLLWDRVPEPKPKQEVPRVALYRAITRAGEHRETAAGCR
jgi:hypothetical protein